MPSVLAIDDDRAILHLIRQALTSDELTVHTATSAAEGMALAKSERPDVALLDIMLPEVSGLELFRQFHALDSKVPVIFVTSDGTSDTAIEAMKLGAYDYVLKPIDVLKLRDLVGRAVEIHRLASVPVGVPGAETLDHKGDQLVGRSPKMQEVYKAVGRVAPQDVTVLIRGESGTGKELIARAIYHHSRRVNGPFLAVNCAAIPEALLESELFGHEKGSFTGAQQRRIGKFEQCHGGTIFLDEVGDMSPLVQSKVLRILQEQRFERVGGNEPIETNVRIIAATHRDLEKMGQDQEFREDLYYRLNGFTIKLPPLRERGGDLLLLIEHCLRRFCREFDKEIHSISPEALNLLTSYPWPGNVRELQSVIRQALLQATGPVIVPEFLPETVRNAPRIGGPGGESGGSGDLAAFVRERLRANTQDLYAESLELMERQVLTDVLRSTDGNQSQAAKILGITRGSLRNKIRGLGITLGHTVSVEDGPDDEPAAEEPTTV